MASVPEMRFPRRRTKPIVHFLHIGKTAGTAIKAALEPSRESGPCSIRLHNHDVTLAQVPAGERFFLVARDPVDRFVSGFYSRQRKGQPRYVYEWSTDEAVAFARFHTANELAAAISSPDAGTRSTAKAAMAAIQHVCDPYARWIGTCDHLLSRSDDLLMPLFQDRLEQDFGILLGRLGLGSAGVTLPEDDVAAHRSPVALDRRLDRTALTNLQQWYAKDYELLALLRRLAPQSEQVEGPITGG